MTTTTISARLLTEPSRRYLHITDREGRLVVPGDVDQLLWRTGFVRTGDWVGVSLDRVAPLARRADWCDTCVTGCDCDGAKDDLFCGHRGCWGRDADMPECDFVTAPYPSGSGAADAALVLLAG